MSDFDFLELDGRMLRGLVAVHEEGSVTRAALRLGLTQSAVSHMLDRLRTLVGDPLFVKAGRGIAATRRADELALRARALLEDMRSFATPPAFVPAALDMQLTIAANDFQRDLLLPMLLRRLRAEAPGLRLRVIPSDIPDPDQLRGGGCRLVISPRPPDALDILQRRLLTCDWSVFYDPDVRDAPPGLEEWLGGWHAGVMYAPARLLELDADLEARGVHRKFAVLAPGFSALPAFLKGGELMATAPSLLHSGLMAGLAACPPPVPCPPIRMYMIWHARDEHDPAHAWVREALIALARHLAGARQAKVEAGFAD